MFAVTLKPVYMLSVRDMKHAWNSHITMLFCLLPQQTIQCQNFENLKIESNPKIFLCIPRLNPPRPPIVVSTFKLESTVPKDVKRKFKLVWRIISEKKRLIWIFFYITMQNLTPIYTHPYPLGSWFGVTWTTTTLGFFP